MNKKEISEIKKQLTPANCNITRICGCYVDAEKNKKTVIVTDDSIYITSYGTQTLMSRGNEFFNIIGGRK